MVDETTNITKIYATSLADDAITLGTQKEVPWMVGIMACLSHSLSHSLCVCVCVCVYVYNFFALPTKSKRQLLAEGPDHWMENYDTDVLVFSVHRMTFMARL